MRAVSPRRLKASRPEVVVRITQPGEHGRTAYVLSSKKAWLTLSLQSWGLVSFKSQHPASPRMPFTAALVQARPALGDVQANAARVMDALRRESGGLVVFPELFLSGYAVRDGFSTLALAEDGPVVAELAAACRAAGKHPIVGAPPRSAVRGVLHNSLLLFTPQGYAGRYDKVYLPTFSL